MAVCSGKLLRNWVGKTGYNPLREHQQRGELVRTRVANHLPGCLPPEVYPCRVVQSQSIAWLKWPTLIRTYLGDLQLLETGLCSTS